MNAIQEAMERRLSFIEKRAATPPGSKKGVSLLTRAYRALKKGLAGQNARGVRGLPAKAGYKTGKGLKLIKDNPGKAAGIVAGPATLGTEMLTDGGVSTLLSKAAPGKTTTNIPAPGSSDFKAFEGAKEERIIREKQEAEKERLKEERRRRHEEAKKEGKDPEGRWIPGIDNTLTAGAGGGVAGATGGYFLGKHLGWDPISSSLVGGLGTATAAAMLAHHLKQGKKAAIKEGKADEE